MAKKFTVKDSSLILDSEEAIAEYKEQEALANINWRKELKLMPWQTFADVSLPDGYFESQLAKIKKLQHFTVSYYQTFCDLLAMSSDYAPDSQDWLQITRDVSIKYFFEDGRMSPLFPTLVSSLLNIAKEDAQNKKTKTMKEWKGTIDLLTEEMLPRDESKIQLSAENNSLRGEICELKDKLNETKKHNYMITTYTFSKKDNDKSKTQVDIGDVNPADYDVKSLLQQIDSQKKKISEMEKQAKLDQMCIDDDSAEIVRLTDLVKETNADATMWRSKFEDASEKCKKAEHERDVYKELMRETPGSKKFTVRQTSIIAYALCKKAGVIPANKKNISTLFNGITGYSANSMGQNLCSSYTDEEIEEIAVAVEKNMPEFAAYLREKTFFLPEKKK